MQGKSTIVNTCANLLSRAWTMVANFVFVPLYIGLLGEEAYGLVTFFATMQTVLNLLGMGLSKTLRREFATDETSGKTPLYKYKMLRSVESVYLLIAVLIIVLCFAGANAVTENWLNIENLSSSVVSFTICLMGISIAAQMIANLYLGCLFGMELQVTANLYQIVWSMAKNVGVILVVSLIYADIRMFYAWHIITDIIYLLVVRMKVVRQLKKQECSLKWSIKDFSNLKSIYRFAFGVMIISLGYAINSQIDKLIISNEFTLTVVGAYNSAYNLSYVSVILTSALGIAVFPKLTKLFSMGNYDRQNQLYTDVNRVANRFTCALGAFIAVFAYEIISVWTGSTEIAAIVENVAGIVIIGTTLSALQEIPYNYFLACGVTKVNNIQTILCIIYVLVITPMCIHKWGLLGAGIAWLAEMFVSTTLYLTVFYNKYFKNNAMKYIVFDTYGPLFLNICIAVLVKKAMIEVNMSRIMCIVCAIICGAIVLVGWFGVEYLSKRKKIHKEQE